MIRAVLFDLDGTLLDIDINGFLSAYFRELGPVLATLTSRSPEGSLAALREATEAMFGEHPGRTNRDVFDERFRAVTGVDLSASPASSAVDAFYRDRFPSLRASHGPRDGAHDAVHRAREAGMKTVLATNPMFPRAAIVERLRWTGIDVEMFDLVTTYETSHACKPLPGYFLQIAESLSLAPEECLMVGDDPDLDLPASAVGMRTFYVGPGRPEGAHRCGSLLDFSGLLYDLAL